MCCVCERGCGRGRDAGVEYIEVTDVMYWRFATGIVILCGVVHALVMNAKCDLILRLCISERMCMRVGLNMFWDTCMPPPGFALARSGPTRFYYDNLQRPRPLFYLVSTFYIITESRVVQIVGGGKQNKRG